MRALPPYSGSLLRLAITTVAIMAVFAGALVMWQASLAAASRRSMFHAAPRSATP